MAYNKKINIAKDLDNFTKETQDILGSVSSFLDQIKGDLSDEQREELDKKMKGADIKKVVGQLQDASKDINKTIMNHFNK